MTPAQFFEKFDLLSDLPNAVGKMRELILDLAVTGRLVSQDSADEPASVLLERIAAKRGMRPLVGKGRTARIRESDFPTDEADSLPSGWAVAPLSALVEVLNGRAYSKDELLDAGIPVLRVGNLFTSNHWYYSDLQLGPEKYCDQGDLLFAWSASFGPFIWEGPKVIFHYHIWKLSLHSEDDTNKKYLYWFLQNRTQEIKRAGHGVSMIHMTKEKMEKLRVWFPPLAEQKRIVAKVDELMVLCDRLEAQQKQREAQQAALVQASLTRFIDAPTPANLEFLFHKSYAVDPAELRKTILTLAVQGKLVSQEQTLEADLSFTDIGSDISELEGEFPLPVGWVWQDLGTMLSFGPTNGISPKSVDYETPVCSLTLSATSSGKFKSEHSKYIPIDVDKESDLWLRDGDILVQRGNTIDLVGVSAVYHGAPNRFVYPDLMMKIRINQDFNVDFVHLAMSAEYARNFLRKRATGTSGTMPKINQTTLKRLPIPKPSLGEQKRIVAKVEELMGVVDRLEAQLAASREVGAKLIEAVVAEIAAAA